MQTTDWKIRLDGLGKPYRDGYELCWLVRLDGTYCANVVKPGRHFCAECLGPKPAAKGKA